jgi:hypothetical protein
MISFEKDRDDFTRLNIRPINPGIYINGDMFYVYLFNHRVLGLQMEYLMLFVLIYQTNLKYAMKEDTLKKDL